VSVSARVRIVAGNLADGVAYADDRRNDYRSLGQVQQIMEPKAAGVQRQLEPVGGEQRYSHSVDLLGSVGQRAKHLLGGCTTSLGILATVACAGWLNSTRYCQSQANESSGPSKVAPRNLATPFAVGAPARGPRQTLDEASLRHG